MARESKRLRNVRRFGPPERLADQLQCWPCDFPPGSRPDAGARMALRSTCLLADDVLREFDACGSDDWGWSDLPGLRLPFNKLLIEAPLSGTPAGSRVGMFLVEGPSPAESMDFVRPILPAALVKPGSPYVTAAHTLAFRLVASLATRRRCYSIGAGLLFLDGHRHAVGKPAGHWRDDVVQCLSLSRAAVMKLADSLFPLCLALGLMNCRNTSTVLVDPDKALNRRRRAANLPPLVSYRRIDVGPLARLITVAPGDSRTGEGRAMHAVRGHIAHFDEDRPLFGRPGACGDFWIPPHVRGDIRNGVVVADYRARPG